jgi:histidinol phosphatase-like enzyme
MRTAFKITAFGAALLVAGFTVTASVVSLEQQSAQSAQITRLQSQARADRTELQKDGRQIVSLTNQVGVLSVPSDPLSAYNDICNAQLTNNQTGITQTYYYPCTNVATTIPQPGN